MGTKMSVFQITTSNQNYSFMSYDCKIFMNYFSTTNGRLHDSSVKSQTSYPSQTDVKPSIQMLVWSGKFQIVRYDGLSSWFEISGAIQG